MGREPRSSLCACSWRDVYTIPASLSLGQRVTSDSAAGKWLSTDELELRYATAGALAGTTNKLYADCNAGFEVRYRSVPTIQSGYTMTH